MIVSWNTTNACNMYCEHCYRDAGCKAEDELSTLISHVAGEVAQEALEEADGTSAAPQTDAPEETPPVLPEEPEGKEAENDG